MNAKSANVVRVEAHQIGILRIVFGDGEHRDETVGRERDQLIFEQMNQHDGGGHLNYFRISIVQFAVLRIDAQFVALLHQTVAAHQQEVVPPQQTAGHNEILLLRFVAKQFPFAGDQRVEGDAGSAGDGNIRTVVADCTELQVESGLGVLRAIDAIHYSHTYSNGPIGCDVGDGQLNNNPMLALRQNARHLQ